MLISKPKAIKFNNKIFFILIYLCLNFYIYLNSYQSFRLFAGFFFSITPIVIYLIHNENIFTNFTRIYTAILFLAIIFTPRLSEYNTTSIFNFSTVLTPEEVKYSKIKNSDYVTPEYGELCWVNPNCIPYVNNFETEYKNSYIIYKN